jgi:hypothetical protein
MILASAFRRQERFLDFLRGFVFGFAVFFFPR